MQGSHSMPGESSSRRLSNIVKSFNVLKTIFDSLPDGIVAILDANLGIASANKAITRLLDLPEKSIVGQNAGRVFQNKIPDLIEVIKETISTRKGVRNYTVDVIRPSGEPCSFLVSTAIIRGVREPAIGVVLILHDISELTRLRKLGLKIDRYGELIGKSEKMKNIYALVETIKHYESTVLILGETGTGKELLARTIHNMSKRKNKPFVPVNCSALPEGLIESELFGHVKGAFTGAESNRIGRFGVAEGGSLFLDEVGTLNMSMQSKLLRVIQEKIIEPVGSSDRRPIDVRIISATNRDPFELVAKDEFREDLYYRLKVIQIKLPPLRERTDDILLLADFFISRLNRYYNKNIVGLSASAVELLANYFWPGNVRELENSIEHAFVLTEGAFLEARYFPPEIRHANQFGTPLPPPGLDVDTEEENIRKALLSSAGRIGTAAEMLGLHRSTLWRKMREYKIDKDFGKHLK